MQKNKKFLMIVETLEKDNIITDEKIIETLVEHIDTHKYFLSEAFKKEVSWENAFESWYSNIYMAVIYYSSKVILQRFFKKNIMELFFMLSNEWYYMILRDRVNTPLINVVLECINKSKRNKILKKLTTLSIEYFFCF